MKQLMYAQIDSTFTFCILDHAWLCHCYNVGIGSGGCDDRKCDFESTKDRWVDRKYMQVDGENVRYNWGYLVEGFLGALTSQPSNLLPITYNPFSTWNNAILEIHGPWIFSRTSFAASTLAGLLQSGGSQERSEITLINWKVSILTSMFDLIVTHDSCNSVYWRPSLWRMFISPLILSRIVLLAKVNINPSINTGKQTRIDMHTFPSV